MHMFCLLSAYRMPKKVEKKGKNTFRFSIIRRKIQTVFQSKVLKTALLAELYGGKDAALVAQMVDSVSPMVQPPVQVVTPLPPVGNEVSDEEMVNREVDHVLWDLDSYLEAELFWMDQMDNEESEVEESDDDSDPDDISEDEGYTSSPEVDFEQYDFWALGLNSHIWRIGLYKEDKDGYWTL